MTVEANTSSDLGQDCVVRPRRGRILVVEDERHIAKFLEYVLRKYGYEVRVEHDAEGALETVPDFLPDALLLDLVLPRMSGLDLLHALRAGSHAKNIVIIVLSAHWFGQEDRVLTEAGASAQCSKPIAPSTLIRKLREFEVTPQMHDLPSAAN